MRLRTRLLLTCEREKTGLGRMPGRQFDEAEARGPGDVARWCIHVDLHDQRLRLQRGKMRGQFVGTIGGIEWDARRASSHRETGHGHVCTIREHEHNPILAAYAHGTQRLYHIVDVLP